MTDLRLPLEPNTIAPQDLRLLFGLMTESELAGALGITETTLASWRKAGLSPVPIKIGRGVFYTHAMVEAWLELTQEDQCDELEKELQEELDLCKEEQALKERLGHSRD